VDRGTLIAFTSTGRQKLAEEAGMMRPLLAAALLVCLAVAAPSAAGEVRAATHVSTAGSYIVVFKADATDVILPTNFRIDDVSLK
jgi:hypothetical protein